ncbi:synaptophysin-like isoform X2 [Penaeus monodon]|uniref:synaptophysin-like isoform X2 n=1 Tax=Penaeus monodon TaxID=6687 RepID=UPI0018A7A297|nr:synaptophysin-like isoform X2 [Penaeus monodon]
MEPMPMQYEQQPPPVYMEQPKNPIQGILANLNTRVLKEPRGFMKILQFVFGISAFATTTSFSTKFSFVMNCQNKTIPVSGTVDYPFAVDSMNQKFEVCDGTTQRLYISGDFSSDAEFYVAVGVLAFLYIIGAVVLYCYFSHMYENNPLVPLVDCASHVLFAILWLAGSSAWANSLTNLGMATSVNNIIEDNSDFCKPKICVGDREPNYSKLVISVILGFLNVFLWASNLWFLYKETHYFKAKTQNQADGTNPMGAA